MKEVYILHQRQRDEKGVAVIQILGVYKDLKKLYDFIPLTSKPSIDVVKTGLKACGTFFFSDNTKLFYEIYSSELMD